MKISFCQARRTARSGRDAWVYRSVILLIAAASGGAATAQTNSPPSMPASSAAGGATNVVTLAPTTVVGKLDVARNQIVPDLGASTYTVTKDQIVAGRGGRDYWTDLKLDTLPDVSREHFRLRRDPATGQFFLTDVSSLGTTIEGAKAPPQQEAPLPARAKIGLAGVLFLEFRSTTNG